MTRVSPSIYRLGISLLILGSWFTVGLTGVGAAVDANPLIGQEATIIQRTNAIRQAAGLPVLVQDGRLMQSAFNKASDMAVRSYFNHGSPEGWRMAHWINGAGYSYSLAGENIAKGFTSIDRVMDAWVASSLHYKNLVEPEFEHIGVGIAQGTLNGEEVVFIVQHFGVEYETNTDQIVSSISSSDISSNEPIETIVENKLENITQPVVLIPLIDTAFAGFDEFENVADVVIAASGFEKAATADSVGDFGAILGLIVLAGMGYLIDYLERRKVRKDIFAGTNLA